MAVAQMEDLNGHCEAVVFPKTYARVGQYIKAKTPVIVLIRTRDQRQSVRLDSYSNLPNAFGKLRVT